ncbi:uncharacterized protein LOC129246413 [Anastrepha obliqua]|uniref:uncharacterized protein LOC129246413 n=1 Tax=Anastrepha obliqua TaxID=95512 RepID=UPI00240A28D9|nr:uncharacterized protein LOC129246413 [Anastrepha obliqua]XP_054741197.1 uncharacterized protein LOC129246413 [Anastrepha obliqua]
MPKFVADKSLCNISLRNACLGIAIFCLVILVLGVVMILVRGNWHFTSPLIGYIILLISNLALLFGALLSNAWLVLVWLVLAAVFFIFWFIALFGVIFNYGDYRAAAPSDNVYLNIFADILELVIFGYFAYLVFSYFYQLRNKQSATSHDV